MITLSLNVVFYTGTIHVYLFACIIWCSNHVVYGSAGCANFACATPVQEIWENKD